MCATTLLNTLLGIKYARVTQFEFHEMGLVCDVDPTTMIPRCGGCGEQVRRVHDRRSKRTWRHLDLCGMTLHLRYVRVAWATVGAMVGRGVERMLPGDRLDGCAGSASTSSPNLKHHKYVTVVVDHDTGRLVRAREGKNADTLKAFFAELGQQRSEALETVAIDMSGGYIAAVEECAPKARLIFDRFQCSASCRTRSTRCGAPR